MGVPRRLLGEGERVVVQLRTHGKALVAPVLALLVLAGVTGLAVALMPEDLAPVGWMALAILVAAGVLGWVVVPFARWRTTTYTLTSRRLITRRGILSRHGHDVPLSRIVDVSYQRSLGDRLLGCGTLQLRTASEAEPLVLPDVPDVARVHLMVSELVFGPQAQLAGGPR
ncbi:PH domain-containing protein [Auraticoccus monumenti]|nr:PH domain-containing protein [Auraticoccus monumenti]